MMHFFHIFVVGLILLNRVESGRKCCPAGYYLDTSGYSCSPSANDSVFGIDYGFPQCPINFTITTIKDDTFEDATKQACYDVDQANQSIIISCKPPTSMLPDYPRSMRKCCGFQEAFLSTKECNTSYLSINVTLHNIINGREVVINSDLDISDFTLIMGDVCPGGNKYFLNPQDPEDEHYILTNGSVFLPKAAPPWPRLLSRDRFCVENIEGVGFRVFLCFGDEDVTNTVSPFVNAVEIIGLILSCIFFTLTFLYYIQRRKKNNVHSWSLMTYVLCLLVAFLSITVLRLFSFSEDSIACETLGKINLPNTLGLLTLFSFMSSFFWLNVLSIDIWKKLRAVRSQVGGGQRKKLFQYSMFGSYAWGTSLIITVVCLLFKRNILWIDEQYRPKFLNCWLSKDNNGFLIFFIVPALIPTVVNCILSIFTAWRCYKVKSAIAKMHRDQQFGEENKFSRSADQFCLILKLFLVMGTTWIFELISSLNKFIQVPHWFWWMTDALNTLNGLIIFMIFVLKKRRIHSMANCLRNRTNGQRPRENSAPNDSSFKTCSTSLLQNTNSVQQ